MNKLREMILFPAIYIGYDELYYSLMSMDLGDILVVCEEDFLVHGVEGNIIADDFKDMNNLITKVDEWAERNDVKFTGMIAIDERMDFRFQKNLLSILELVFIVMKH